MGWLKMEGQLVTREGLLTVKVKRLPCAMAAVVTDKRVGWDWDAGEVILARPLSQAAYQR